MKRRLAPAVLASSLVLAAACSTDPTAATSPAAPRLSRGQAPADAGPQFVPGEVLVKFRAGASERGRGAAMAAANAQAAERILTNAMRRGGDEEGITLVRTGLGVGAAMQALRNSPDVEYAEPNWIYTTDATSNDPLFTDRSLWGMYGATTSPANQFGSNAAAAWASGRTGSRAVFVGVIDEGIQVDHPDLRANMWTNPFDPVDGRDNDGNGFVDDVNGWDFANNDNTVYDGGRRGASDTHGTHVAGTIGAVGGNSTGVAGVNWQVTMISGKFLGRNGGTTANAVRAVDYFTTLKTRHGLNIVATSNSWGGGGFSQALRDAIARADRAGILFIAAAGNSSVNCDNTSCFPANYDVANVISVASITSTGALSSFSNFGATNVDIGAPGSGIQSTLPPSTYGAYSGTSMATPHVSGAAALYAAVKPGSTAATIKNAILTGAVPTSSLAGRTGTGGRLDVNAALAR